MKLLCCIWGSYWVGGVLLGGFSEYGPPCVVVMLSVFVCVWITQRTAAHPPLTHRYQRAVPALLRRRPAALPVLRAAAASSSSSRSPAAAARCSLPGLVPAGLGLPVLVGSLGFGLQTALVQGEGLLPLQLQPLQRRVLVAALAAVVMLPEELDPPAEPLHHRAVSRCNKIRHHQ